MTVAERAPGIPSAYRPLGSEEISKLLGTERRTVNIWRNRGILPAPDLGVVSRVPLWTRGTILAWALQTGRITDREYRKLTAER